MGGIVITAFELAGFFAAHAIWCVSDGELTPMLAFTSADGQRSMERLVFSDVTASIAEGRQRLEANGMDADDAALLFDGRITLDGNKVDAVIIEIRCYFSPTSEGVLAVPYTPKSAGSFRVHRPKLLAWKDCEDFSLEAVLESFWKGMASHEKGAPVWNAHLDESR